MIMPSFCVRFFGHCSCYNIIIIKLNCQSEVGVLRVKNEKFSKIALTKNGGKYYGYSGNNTYKCRSVNTFCIKG